MERAKSIIVCILSIICFSSLKGEYRSLVYRSFITSNMDLWKTVIDEMSGEKHKTNDFMLELINYQYGYIAWCIGEGHHRLAEEYLKKAETILQVLEERAYRLSHVYSYKSAFYAYRIGLNRLKAPFLGPRTVRYANMAIELDPKNPYGYIQYGNALFYMPAVFGGSKAAALEYFIKAEVLMEPNKEKNWNYLNLLTFIAINYTELDDFEMAKAYYEMILTIEPDFSWVKDELYPAFLKKIE
jgi:tetratricopeptide (TPR) repeat protein